MTTKKKREKKQPYHTNVVVCPICFRENCKIMRLFKMYRYSDDENNRLARYLHRPVCPRCKRIHCKTFKGIVKTPCIIKQLVKEKRGANGVRHFSLPSWWTE